MPSELQRLGRAVKQAQYRHHRAMDRALAQAGTTLVQWDALRAIGNAPGASAHELAVATFQSDQAFGTLATRLARQGLIERRTDRGRRVNHHLTPAGQQLLDEGNLVAERMMRRSFAGFTADERRTLEALLGRVGVDLED